MEKKVLIFDLDNTIYAVSSIAQRLFAPLFQLLDESGELGDHLPAVKQDLQRKPFQWVAKNYGFSSYLQTAGHHLLQNLVYEGPIEAFPDYQETKSLSQKKYLVTSGFQKMQESKIQGLQLAPDFEKIWIVDVDVSTKKEVFEAMLQQTGYQPSECLAIGDDPDSELTAARELGMDAMLYLHHHPQPAHAIFPAISDFRQLPAFL